MTAVMAEGVDAGVPAHFGDPMREQRILAEQAGVVDRGNRGVVAVPGADRLSWLHDLATQHLVGLPAYQGTETLLLSPHGHIEHHAAVVDDGETTWLDTEPGDAAPLLDYLQKMRFFAQVEPRDASAEIAVLSLVGPQADAAVKALGLAEPLPPVDVVPPPGPKFPAGSVPSRPTAVYPAAAMLGGGLARRMSDNRIDLLVPRSDVDRVVREVAVPRCGIWAYEALRVADRTPRFGLDTDHRTLPHEAGWLATSVHLEKGCYRGQETVARVHNLGRPPRRLTLLHLDGSSEQLPASGTAVELDGRQVGFVGTAVRHYEYGMIALATVKRNVPDDARLMVAGLAAAIEPA